MGKSGAPSSTCVSARDFRFLRMKRIVKMRAARMRIEAMAPPMAAGEVPANSDDADMSELRDVGKVVVDTVNEVDGVFCTVEAVVVAG